MIQVCRPSTTSKEIVWVLKALKENRISSTGGYVEQFEEEFAKKIGSKYCVAVNSGGSALFLALWALGIRAGDEVIIPTFTMIATANAVDQCGAKPVLVDADWDTCNIDVKKIEKKITSKTKAILPVHIYGHPCEMDVIMRLAKKHNLFVVEDCAEAHGAEFRGKKVGTFGDIGCWSFYANKIITTGEGGAITTNNASLAKEIRQLKAYYFSPVRHFDHQKIGWNYRMSSLEAAYGLGQLERMEELIAARISNANTYNVLLKDLVEDGLIETPIEKMFARNVYWMYLIKVGKERDRLMLFLEKNGIETRTGFFPVHWQKPYAESGGYPTADKLGAESLYLPSSSDLTMQEIRTVVQKIKEYYGYQNFNRRSRGNREGSI